MSKSYNREVDHVTRVETWQTVVIQLKSRIEQACGRTNTITASTLDDWERQIAAGARDGQEICRQIAMQTVVTDYLINESLNGGLSEDEIDSLCQQLAEPGGLDNLYARLLHLVGGSGQIFKDISIAPADPH